MHKMSPAPQRAWGAKISISTTPNTYIVLSITKQTHIKCSLSCLFLRIREKKRQIYIDISEILLLFKWNCKQPTTLTKHRARCWGSLLLLLPAAERSWCSTTPSCGPWHRGRRQPAGTTPATPPQRQSSCIQTSCSPALGEEGEEGRGVKWAWWGKMKGGETGV